MRLTWLFGLSDRSEHSLRLWLPPLLLALSLGTLLWLSSVRSGGVIREALPAGQAVGTSLLFALLPPYLWLMGILLYRRTRWLLETIAPMAPADSLAAVEERLLSAPRVSWFLVPLGFLFGLSQNFFVVQLLRNVQSIHPLDLAFLLGNCLVWSSVALVLSWRLPLCIRISALGARLPVNLLRLDRLQPLARVATLDVLVIAGAMALMPLQSLDAQFRIYNYQWGVAVGLPAALTLFCLPMLGARRSIRRVKQDRLKALDHEIAGTDQADLQSLELKLAHRDRIAAIAEWPLNTRLITRTVAYVILPPLAWVAAALVENLVDSL